MCSEATEDWSTRGEIIVFKKKKKKKKGGEWKEKDPLCRHWSRSVILMLSLLYINASFSVSLTSCVSVFPYISANSLFSHDLFPLLWLAASSSISVFL